NPAAPGAPSARRSWPADRRDPHLPSHDLVCRLLSAPRANTSIRLGPQETAAGSDDICSTPSWYQPCHRLPSHDLVHSTPSVPRTNTSRRPGPHEETAGPEAISSTPSEDQLVHRLPSHDLVYSRL